MTTGIVSKDRKVERSVSIPQSVGNTTEEEWKGRMY
jgi:hypothetical protein